MTAATAAATLTKEFLASFMTMKGIPKVIGIFKAALSGTYGTIVGVEVDTSPYFRSVDIAVPLSTEDTDGYSFQIDDGDYSSGKFKVELINTTRAQTESGSYAFTLGSLAGTASGSTVTTGKQTVDAITGSYVSGVTAGAGQEYTNITVPSGIKCRVLVIGS